MQELERRVELCATPSDLQSTVAMARAVTRAASAAMLPPLCKGLELEAASIATAGPTKASIAALIATAVSEAVGGMEARLGATVSARLAADAEEAQREEFATGRRQLSRAQAELRSKLAECEACASADVRALRRRALPLAPPCSFSADAAATDAAEGLGAANSSTGSDDAGRRDVAPAQLARLRACNRAVAEHRTRLLLLQKAAAQQERLRLQHDRDASHMAADADAMLERHFLDAYFMESGSHAQLVADVAAMEERGAQLDARLQSFDRRLASSALHSTLID